MDMVVAMNVDDGMMAAAVAMVMAQMNVAVRGKAGAVSMILAMRSIVLLLPMTPHQRSAITGGRQSP